jgi:putative ABC transport system substrate-binding protein
MTRREFIALAGAMAAAHPLRAEQKSMPVIGFLSGATSDGYVPFVAAFRRGLSEAGWIDGHNMMIEYRWAEGHYERLPVLADELIARKVDVIATSGGPAAAYAAKNATSTIPIVFTSGDDPVASGIVASLARPGGNLTGVSFLNVELTAKRLELLSDLVPQARTMALLVNPTNPNAERIMRDAQEAARTKGVQLHMLKAANESGIDSAFVTLAELRISALVVGSDPFFVSRREQLVGLAARYAVPAINEMRGFVDSGGLISYGTSIAGVYHQLGIYAGKILKGAKPADLPVGQPTTFELVVNLKTAKALGLRVPPSILARTDEVIE